MMLTIKELEDLLEELKLKGADSLYLDITYDDFSYSVDGIDFDAYRDDRYISTIMTKRKEIKL